MSRWIGTVSEVIGSPIYSWVSKQRRWCVTWSSIFSVNKVTTFGPPTLYLKESQLNSFLFQCYYLWHRLIKRLLEQYKLNCDLSVSHLTSALICLSLKVSENDKIVSINPLKTLQFERLWIREVLILYLMLLSEWSVQLLMNSVHTLLQTLSDIFIIQTRIVNFFSSV